MTPNRAARPLAVGGLLAIAAGVLVIGLLHLLPGTAHVDLIEDTISEYSLTDSRWIFDAGVLLVAFGSAVVFLALLRARLIRPLSAPSVFGAMWTVSLLVVVVFQKTNWAIGPSVNGTIHRYASVIAFLALPLAVLFAARTAFPRSATQRRLTVGLAASSLLWFALILTAVTNMALGGEPWWTALPLGLVERAMALHELLALTALGLAAVNQPVVQLTGGRLEQAATGR